MSKKVTCKICFLQDHTDNQDLNSDIHEGFTVGRGKKMYWQMSWTPNGHCYIFREDEKGDGLVRRWVSGDQLITIHWK